MSVLKTSLPRFEGRETMEERMEAVLRYLNTLEEQLKFTLSHLGAGNINGAGFDLAIRTAGGKDEQGRMGLLGSGVGFSGGGAEVKVEGGAVLLTAGEVGLKVSAAGVFRTEDGGKTWTGWKEEGNETD